jgi:quercetin dioxygenase-like cupin family protein
VGVYGMKAFAFHSGEGYKQVAPGILQKTLIYGEKTLMAEFILHTGSSLPEHAHPFEQTGYLAKGRIELKIGTESHDVHQGDSWCIPMNVVHGAKILEDSIAIEVFSPRRDDYIP